MKIQVLGSGCDKCKKLAANAQEAAAKLGLDCEIEKITDINKITEFGVMMTPALVVDGKVVCVGKVLSPDEIGAFLKPAPCSLLAVPVTRFLKNKKRRSTLAAAAVSRNRKPPAAAEWTRNPAAVTGTKK